MERNEFLKLLGTASLAACASCALESCSSSSDPGPSGPTNVDFTLDLTAMANSNLTTDSGSMYFRFSGEPEADPQKENGIVIVRLSATNYVALSQSCTHQGTTINFVPLQGNFLCPNHGSRFSTTGSVINGPATSSLRKYNTTLTGTDLRVFS